MKKFVLPGLFVLLFIIFTLAMAAILNAGATSSAPPGTRIAVVMYGTGSNDRWKSLELGIRQACRELEIETPITLVTGEDMQTVLIDREISDGVDGMLIAPENSEDLAVELELLSFTIPTVFVMNGIEGFSYVSADDVGMGRLLAEKLAARGGRIGLIINQTGRENARRREEGFLAYMEAAGVSVTRLTEVRGQGMERMLADAAGTVDTIVALDTETLEKAIDAFTESPLDAALCGIGGSDKVVHALSQGIVSSVVFQNEYAVGYIATMQLAAKLGLGKLRSDDPIQYLYADSVTMYEPDTARLLFSIVQ